MTNTKMTKTKSELGLAEDAEHLQTFVNNAAARLEVGRDDVQVPRIILLQDMNPQVQKLHEMYVPGVEAGQFFNMLTQEAMDTFDAFVVDFNKFYEERTPKIKDKQGTYVGRHALDAEVVKTATRIGYDLVTTTGNVLHDVTEYTFLVVPESGRPYLAAFAFKSTKLAQSKAFMGQAAQRPMPIANADGSVDTAPVCIQKYRFKAVGAANKENQKFYNIGFDFLGFATKSEAQVISSALSAKQATRQAIVTATVTDDNYSTDEQAALNAMK